MVKSKAHPKKRIAVIGAPVLEAESLFNAALIEYAARELNWQFIFSTEATVEAFRFLRQLKCDGALVRIISPAIEKEARRIGFPIVNWSSWLSDPHVPTVRCDNHAMGRLCAEHLLEKGFRRFGVVLFKMGWFIQARYQGFLAAIRAAGFADGVSLFSAHSRPVDAGDLQRLRAWVTTLQVPAALFLTDDENAPAVMQACRVAGRRIPHDLAVIAGFGHVQICRTCQPPLTYVDQNEAQIAVQAADYLERLMSGKTREVKITAVPTRGIVLLGSTDTVAVDDRAAARAVEFIRVHISEPINIKDVAQNFDIARRTLERRFRTALGISLHEFLTRERIERAQDLLRTIPPLTLSEVARRCGFTNAHRLNLVFLRIIGITPAVWRKQQPEKKPVLRGAMGEPRRPASLVVAP